MGDIAAKDGDVIALDVGGMSIRSGLVRSGQTPYGVVSRTIDHRANADELIDAMAGATSEWQPQPRGRIAIAFPGPFDYANATSLMEHKFASLHNLDLAEALLPELELDIRFVNDAAAAGAAEVLAAGSPPGRTLVLTLGTGLGSALFDGERPIPSHREGSTDHFEIAELWSTQLANGQLADDVLSARGLAEWLGVAARDLPTAVEAASAQAELRAWGSALGDFINATHRRLHVDRVILGGGASGAFDRFITGVEKTTSIPVAQATTGSNGPVVGSATLAFG